jgi:hypothetical protein
LPGGRGGGGAEPINGPAASAPIGGAPGGPGGMPPGGAAIEGGGIPIGGAMIGAGGALFFTKRERTTGCGGLE